MSLHPQEGACSPRVSAASPFSHSMQILVKCHSRASGPPPLDKTHNLDHPHPAIERDGDDIAGSHHAARCVNARPIDSDKAAARQSGGGTARAYQASMPEPTIDALARNRGHHSAALLSVCLKLRLQDGELGKGRIGVGLFLSGLPRLEPFAGWTIPL